MATDSTPYKELGEEAGICRLVERFYQVMDEAPEAKAIRDMHGDDLGPITQKLSDYLCEWLGGPKLYSEKTGTVCLTRPHAAYKLDEEARDQWLFCMEQALRDVDASAGVQAMLKEPFFRIADIMRNDC